MRKNVNLAGLSLANESDQLFIWVSEFDDESLVRFYEKFSELERNPFLPFIPVVISSYGGDVSVLMAMRDLIKSSNKPVATIGLGKAMSCGACLLAAGTKGFRFASKDTAIMVHEVSGGAIGKTTDVAEQAIIMQELNRKLLANLAKDSGKSHKQIEKKLKSKKNADWTLTAAEAREWGIVDHVAVPRIAMQETAVALAKSEPYDELFKKINGPQKGHPAAMPKTKRVLPKKPKKGKRA